MFGLFGKTEDTHTATDGNPVQNTAAALDTSTGTGTHLSPTDQSRNPLSSHNDHVDTAQSNNPILHNETTGTGHSSLTGTTTHSKREDGGVVDAIDPTKDGGAHLPISGHNQTSVNQYDNTHSSNPLSSNTHATGPHASTGAGLTGSSHATHGHRAEDGGVVDAVNPLKGSGPHVPSSGQHDSSLTGDHHGTGLTGTHQNDPVHNTAASLDPHTGTGTHLPGTQGSNKPLSTRNDHNDTTHSSNPLAHNSTTGTGHESVGHKAEVKKDQALDGAHSSPHSTATPAKVPVMDKVKGTVEALVGKVTGNPAKVAEVEALKTGHHVVAGAPVNPAVHK